VKRSFGLALGAGSQPIETFGTIKEFAAGFSKLRLSCQVSQDFSRVPVLLRLSGRRKILDHVDFPPISRSGERTPMRDLSSRYALGLGGGSSITSGGSSRRGIGMGRGGSS